MNGAVEAGERVEVAGKQERPVGRHTAYNRACFAEAAAHIMRVQVRDTERHVEHVHAQQAVHEVAPRVIGPQPERVFREQP